MSVRALVAILIVLPGCGAEPPEPPPGLGIARAAHTATPLGGRVLIAGGCVTDGCGSATDTTELYDDRTGRFEPGPRLTGPRDGHTATLLTDGRVLLAGGYAGEGQGSLATAEICDAERCRPVGSLAHPRGGHAAALLPGNRVLIAGGPDATSELYDSGGFHPGPRMRHSRFAHTATPLDDGRVLVAGGYDPDGLAVAEAEIFDGRRFVATAPLHTARGKHAAVRLLDGRVLLIGGSTDRETRSRLASTEVYDPRTEAFSPGPTLRIARYKLTDAVALLPDGRVLVAGDGAHPEILDVRASRSAEISGRAVGASATATPLGDGRTLVAGGYDDRIAVSDVAFVAVE
jgi:hypothetical protein